jgi:hypothetical protein
MAFSSVSRDLFEVAVSDSAALANHPEPKNTSVYAVALAGALRVDATWPEHRSDIIVRRDKIL